MVTAKLQSQIEAARAYDELFVPALFAQWAPHVADAARLRRGQSVLDVACGTGVLAREAARRTGSEGRVTGLDPGHGMLAVAGEHAPEIVWTEGVAEAIPFADESFDAVVCQFGLMFFANPGLSLREMLRVLKPSGYLALAVWDAIENISGYTRELELLKRLGGPAAGEAVRAPFALGQREDVLAMIRDAGAPSSRANTVHGKAQFPSIRIMMEAELRGWLPVMGVKLGEDVIETILREAESEFADFRTPDGGICFDITAHVIVAQKDAARNLVEQDADDQLPARAESEPE